MTVTELIAVLKKFPPDLPVVYEKYSEQALLRESEIFIKPLGESRPDGWVPNRRPDKPTRLYLVFPGN